MALSLLSLVWEKAPHKDGKLLLLLALADSCNDQGRCWPSVETLAHKARMGERHARRILREFEEEGLLVTTQRGDIHRSNVYDLSLEKLHAYPTRLKSPPSDEGGPEVHEGGSGDAGRGAPIAPQPSGTVIEPPKEEKEGSPEGKAFALAFLKLLGDTGARVTQPTPAAMNGWAITYDRLIRIDGKTKEEIWRVCVWARRDSFWCTNFMAPTKLRDKKGGISYYDQFLNKLTLESNGHSTSQSSNRTGFTKARVDRTVWEELERKQELAAGGVPGVRTDPPSGG